MVSVEVFYKAELFKALFVSQQIQFVRIITITQAVSKGWGPGIFPVYDKDDPSILS